MRQARGLVEEVKARVRPAPEGALSWVEIDRVALEHNYSVLRRLAGTGAELMFVVKANAYGHGLVEVSSLLEDLGADRLATFSLDEALTLRESGVRLPILVMGPTPPPLLEVASRGGVAVTVASVEALERLAEARPGPLSIHLKVETGTNRQGLDEEGLERAAAMVRSGFLDPRVTVEGAYTHLADVEDTTDNTFAMRQLATFEKAISRLERLGVRPPVLHAACTAAALLYPQARYGAVRVGIGLYGLWPSETTRVCFRHLRGEDVELRPVMTWKTRIVQIKALSVGETVGYGRTYQVMRPTRIAVLPVGYYNGYVRGFGGRAYVLVGGKRASVVGRVMMNMTTIDVTDVAGAAVGDEVVLLGRSGSQRLTAERLAGWADTISYEVVANVEKQGRRIVI